MKVLKFTLYFGFTCLSLATISRVFANNIIANKDLTKTEAGLRIQFSELKDKFHRHLVKYEGDCPGDYWSGVAQTGDLRFIDRQTTPAKKLKVDLVNLSTGRKITRSYQKPELGSNDFTLTQLGNRDGEHKIDYTIYNRQTKEILSQGNFVYQVTSSQETHIRDAEWKLELSCSGDREKKLADCKQISARKLKYCDGKKTGDSEHYKTFNLDRKTVEIDL